MTDNTNALCSQQDLKDFLRLSGTTNDTQLDDAINRATEVILAYIDRTILSTAYTEYHDGNDTPVLNLRNYPLIGNPTTVNVDGQRNFAAATAWLTGQSSPADDDYVVESAEGILRCLGDAIWVRGTQNIKVVYTAGYATTPEALKRVGIEFAAYLYRGAGVRGIRQRAEGGLFVIMEDKAIPTAFRETLDVWRRVDPPVDDFFPVLG